MSSPVNTNRLARIERSQGGISTDDLRWLIEQAREAAAQQEALREAVEVIKGLADQQAMTDDWYVEKLARIGALAAGGKP